MKTAWRRLAAVLSAILIFSCARGGDPARECLDDLVKAAHNRDASAFFDRVAADFQAADGSTRADAEMLLRRYFAGYEILDVIVRDVNIEKAENAARVRFRAELSGQPRKIGGLDSFLPRTSSYDFDMRLTPAAGKWKVSWAQWNPSS
jgi:hypothetical protein